jgi:hypothetical protein
MKRTLPLWLTLTFALSGCGSGSLAAPSVVSGPTLQVAITVATANSAITGATLTVTPTNGDPAVSTTRSCAAAGCTVSVPAPIDGSTLRIDLTDSQNHIIHSGSLHVFVQTGGGSVAVAFGGTPASVKVTTKPASFTTGVSSTSTVRALVYDAQGNRMIGQVYRRAQSRNGQCRSLVTSKCHRTPQFSFLASENCQRHKNKCKEPSSHSDLPLEGHPPGLSTPPSSAAHSTPSRSQSLQ